MAVDRWRAGPVNKDCDNAPRTYCDASVNLYLSQSAACTTTTKTEQNSVRSVKSEAQLAKYCSEANDRHEASRGLCDNWDSWLLSNVCNSTGHVVVFVDSPSAEAVCYHGDRQSLHVKTSAHPGYANPLWAHKSRIATDHYTAIRWLVHWPLMAGLLHLVQPEKACAGCGPAQHSCKNLYVRIKNIFKTCFIIW